MRILLHIKVVELLLPPNDSQPGDLLYFEGFDPDPDTVLKSKTAAAVWKRVSAELAIDPDGGAIFKNAGNPRRLMGKKGSCRAPTLKSCQLG